MATRSDQDIDDDFSELYKEYTGPQGLTRSTTTNSQDREKTNKRSLAGSDEEEEPPRDPNAVPTDFTSREAKVWEAKSKATERIWKKRKEEELICKICGESGHFTQGCPSTLGANRKSQDFFERVPAREKHVKALFTEKLVEKIENDIGCKIKMEEKFIIVSGKDRLILAKGVDAVHKTIKEESDQRASSSSHMERSRSPEQSPAHARLRRSDSQKSHSGPQNATPLLQRFGRQERVLEDHSHNDPRKLARASPQAYGNNGARGRSSNSKSPTHHPYPEELELEFKREAMELGKIRDKEEDEESYRHREAIKEMREKYMKQLATLKGMHAKQWEEFLQIDAQRHQQQAPRQLPSSGFGGYKQRGYSEYDGTLANPHYAGANLALDTRSQYSNSVENYTPRPRDKFGAFQRQRRTDYGKPYNRY
ncbi:hypothetical protein CIPAW_08G087500 [Carya illinoinensis]|uniref:CCHC-type domain-containing protein n=1 Tax=Carya illinoinensis TaxID=32201 RepID=A0A8T1PRS3_CARIL|nr:hypothetical protein CIPAW_08G087500 [Carya illinoinensis]KAG6644946.1 hypothetical protein CIPAW_08G087500 [Carya illinoinensis]KAG6644948.1 hypothetical protein CIPAW_08G087500 [Carya illinoinensis]